MKKVYIFAAVLAVLTAISLYKFALILEEKSQPENEEKVSVVIAAVDVSKDTVITEEMIKLVSLPKEAVLNNTFRSAEHLIGRIAAVPFVANEQILATQTAAQGEKTTDRLTYELKKDEYAVTVNVSVITGTAGYVKEGDLLTITKVVANPDGTAKIDVLYEHIPVIRVGENVTRNSTEYSTLTIVLPKKDVFAFISHQESGVIRPVLESAFDEKEQ